MESGIDLITKERQRQLEKHGFNDDHDDDDFHKNNELKDAALYLLSNGYCKYPVNWDKAWKYKFDNKSYKERLIISGALIAAEIDRLNRLEKR